MKLDLLLFGRDRVRAVLRAARTTADPIDREDPLLRHRPDRPRHERGIGPRGGGGGRTRGARARGDGARHAGRTARRARRAVRWVPMPPPFGSPHLRWRARARSRSSRAASGPTRSSSGTTTSAARRSGSRAALGAVGVLEVNAPVVDHAGSSKALLDRALLVRADAALARAPLRPRRRHRHAERRDPAAPGCRRSGSACSSGAPTPIASGPARRDRRRSCGLGVTTVAVFAGAFRSWHGAIHLVEAIKILRARGEKDIGAVFVGDGSGAAARARRPRTGSTRSSSPARCRTTACRRRSPRADIGVAPFDIGAHAPLSLGFYWSPLKIFEYMASGLPVVAPAVDRIPSLVEDGREGLLYSCATAGGATPRRSPTRS